MKKSESIPLNIIRSPEEPVAPEIMERAIIDMQKAIDRINRTRVSRAMLVALIKDKTGLNKQTIELVLNHLDNLEFIWLKKKER